MAGHHCALPNRISRLSLPYLPCQSLRFGLDNCGEVGGFCSLCALIDCGFRRYPGAFPRPLLSFLCRPSGSFVSGTCTYRNGATLRFHLSLHVCLVSSCWIPVRAEAHFPHGPLHWNCDWALLGVKSARVVSSSPAALHNLCPTRTFRHA